MNQSAPEGIQSMTGFGAAEGEAPGSVSWRWELRSVNGKNLDIKFRMPSGTEALEPALRQRARVLWRGTVNAGLRIGQQAAGAFPAVDDAALASAAAAIDKVRQSIDCEKPRPEAILALRGVLSGPQDIPLTEKQQEAVRDGFDEALQRLVDARRQEGGRIVEVLGARCDELVATARSIRQRTANTREAIAERLRSQLGELLSRDIAEDRLAQEAALLAIRADVTEELDRLDAHGDAFRELLSRDAPVGRRLEFLTQELMREATTLTSKLHTADLKSAGLDLKEQVDGLREQVLNVA